MNCSFFDWDKFKNGEEIQLRFLIETYSMALCAYAKMLLLDEQEAEDAVQLVFVNLWVKRSSIIVSNSSIKSYLFRMVHNTSINKIKSEQRRNVVHQLLHASTTHEENWLDSYLDESTINQIRGRIDDAVALLPAQAQKIFIMSRYENKKVSEIAKLLNISTRTVENQLYRSILRLRNDLKDISPIVIGLVVTLHSYSIITNANLLSEIKNINFSS